MTDNLWENLWYHYNGDPMGNHNMHHSTILNTLQQCEAMCEHMTTHIKKRHDVECRIRQLMLLRDCADICTLTAKYIARDSMYAKHIAHVCACICEECANECFRHPDMESQHCGHVCMHCAKECRMFVMM